MIARAPGFLFPFLARAQPCDAPRAPAASGAAPFQEGSARSPSKASPAAAAPETSASAAECPCQIS